MIKAHPVFGLGPEQIGKQFQSYVPSNIPRPLPTGYYGHLHNIYLQYAAERGIPAMLAMLFLIGETLWDAARALRRLPSGRSVQRFLLHGSIAFIIAILVEGLFEFNLGDSEVLMMFVTVLRSLMPRFAMSFRRTATDVAKCFGNRRHGWRNHAVSASGCVPACTGLL